MTWITQAAALCSFILHAQAYVVPSKYKTKYFRLRLSYELRSVLKMMRDPKETRERDED